MPRKFDFGLTPWGAYFIRAMENLADEARLRRGRSYAVNEHVLKMDIEGGTVKAMVEGSYMPWYDVTITFKPLEQKDRDTLFKLIDADPMLVGRIAAGELPKELIERLEKAGVKLLPSRWQDMRRSCTCPDYGDPCKHMAAVYYVLAQEIDRDPSVLFRLRGVDLAERFAGITSGAMAINLKEVSETETVPVRKVGRPKRITDTKYPIRLGRPTSVVKIEKNGDATPTIRKPLEISMVKPWQMPGNLVVPSLPGIGAYGKAVIGFLSPPPPLVPYDLKNALAGFYTDLDQRWERILGPQSLEERSEARMRGLSQTLLTVQVPDTQDGSTRSRPRIAGTLPGGKLEYWTPLEAARMCLASDMDEGSPGYCFLRAFSLAMRMIIASGAFVPDIELILSPIVNRTPTRRIRKLKEPPEMRVVWKPAYFGADVQSLLKIVEGLVPPPIPLEKSEEMRERKAGQKSLSKSVGKEKAIAGKVPDAHSTVLLLAADLLSDIVRELRYLPKGVTDISHPVTAALFRGEPADVSSPLHRSIPKAMDSWLSVFDVAMSEFKYELAVKHPISKSDALPGKLPRYALSATVKIKSEEPAVLRRLALSTAVKRIGPGVLTFPAMLSTFVPELARLGSKPSVILDEAALSRFVIESAPLLGRLGITVVLPKELKTLLKPRPVLVSKKRKGLGNLVSLLGLSSMLSFEWRISIGDMVLSAEEFERMVEAGTALVQFRDEYIRLEASEAASILNRIRKGPKPDVFDAIQEYLSGETQFDETLGKSLATLLGANPSADNRSSQSSTQNPTGKATIPIPKGLCATLRPYQERGFNWIASTIEHGFGCVLADDMGLGKTVQAITYILRMKDMGTLKEGALVCAPATLLTNWERELERFAPSLSISTYYGASRKRKKADITLTSYETFLRDQKKLDDKEWDIVVLDEAHLIKNSNTKRSKAVKAVKTSRRLALSGTPMENHLGELWSIFDFALPGYLRSQEHFAHEYRKPIEVERSGEVIERLRMIIAPFLMRRLKTDKSIIADLPDKIVADEYASLTPEQAALYESVVRDSLAKIEASEGIARRGLILALLIALKQICNHPRNYDKESEPDVERSGKTKLLLAILDTALEAGEKVLVFSQYVEMLEILRSIMERDLGIEPFILHGGLSKPKRDAAIDGFRASSGPGIFLISLKAGGLGLNLTEATRVIHYDLWFNPAVENQATDRAFRIGQKRNVFVHRLITRDSFEEKINALLIKKRELADLTISSGETWLTELDNSQLSALVRR
jgi:uncharacterized Zn finger protein/superfamily II DNA or RNA helicase